MGLIVEHSSVSYLSAFRPVRCDTHFKHKIKLSEQFFSSERISWVSLGSVIDKIQNGMNVATEFYSMAPTDVLYISVSQIKEHGLIEKNQNYLSEDVRSLGNFYELGDNTVLVTRSGTVGVALSEPCEL